MCFDSGRLVFNSPSMTPTGDGHGWEMNSIWRITFESVHYDVAAGFVTDGASIPRSLWRLCGHPLETPRLYAAILHDWLYSGGVGDDGCVPTRAEADRIFRDVLIELGVSRIRAYVEWAAVSVCGGSHWHE